MSASTNVFPKHRQDAFAIKSWGYKDCYFYYDHDEKCLRFKGEKYPWLVGEKFTSAHESLKEVLGIDISKIKDVVKHGSIPDFDFKHVDCEPFRAEIDSKGIDVSTQLDDRYFRSYGQSTDDIANPCHYRIPDIVLWPKCHNDVEYIVKLANEHNVVIIPYGGGSNVTCSVNCPEYEMRTIVSLDTTQMNRLLWLDEKSMLACFESGVAGQNLESVLNEKGYTIGHEPDSMEFSTLGGWIATRSSGIKQHTYGNIEKIVIKVKVVTSIGTFDKTCTPRASMGPEIESLMFGSEGTLGVVTEAVIRIHKLPELKRYGALLFPTFQHGINFMRECVEQNCQPASLRLVDNTHVKCGLAIATYDSWTAKVIEKTKLKLVCAFVVDYTKYSMATYLIEGDKKQISQMEDCLRKISRTFGGWYGGTKGGERAFLMTYVVAYLRDLFYKTGAIQESLETSVTWDKCEVCIENMEKCFNNEITNRGIKGLISYRISQAYHEGCCVYFYISMSECENQRKHYLEIFSLLKTTLLQSGASLSHHHGIGKKNQEKFIQCMPSPSTEVLRAIKRDVDPKNVFGAGNLVFDDISKNLESKL